MLISNQPFSREFLWGFRISITFLRYNILIKPTWYSWLLDLPFYFVCIWVNVCHVCRCPRSEVGAEWMPRSPTYRWLRHLTRVLEAEGGPLWKAAGALTCWAISPASSLVFLVGFGIPDAFLRYKHPNEVCLAYWIVPYRLWKWMPKEHHYDRQPTWQGQVLGPCFCDRQLCSQVCMLHNKTLSQNEGWGRRRKQFI